MRLFWRHTRLWARLHEMARWKAMWMQIYRDVEYSHQQCVWQTNRSWLHVLDCCEAASVARPIHCPSITRRKHQSRAHTTDATIRTRGIVGFTNDRILVHQPKWDRGKSKPTPPNERKWQREREANENKDRKRPAHKTWAMMMTSRIGESGNVSAATGKTLSLRLTSTISAWPANHLIFIQHKLFYNPSISCVETLAAFVFFFDDLFFGCFLLLAETSKS